MGKLVTFAGNRSVYVGFIYFNRAGQLFGE